MLGPITRIILRYVAGALVLGGFLTADLGTMIAEDPDIAAIAQWVIGGAAALIAEGGYWLAKRWDWRT